MSNPCKLVIFNLPDDCEGRDLEKVFQKFGTIEECSVRSIRPGTTMGFITMKDERDAEDALKERHGYEMGDYKIRVEVSGAKGEKGKGSRRDSRDRGRRDRGDSRRRGGRRDSRRRGGRRDSRDRRGGKGKGYGKAGGGKGLHADYIKVVVKDLPSGASWQDLKDFLREAGNVKFTEVNGDQGVGGFDNREEAERACDKLDGSRFKSFRGGDDCKVRVQMDGGGKSRSRSRSRRSRSSRR